MIERIGKVKIERKEKTANTTKGGDTAQQNPPPGSLRFLFPLIIIIVDWGWGGGAQYSSPAAGVCLHNEQFGIGCAGRRPILLHTKQEGSDG